MQHNTQVPVGKHNDKQHASPHHGVATDVKQMPIRPIIIIKALSHCDYNVPYLKTGVVHIVEIPWGAPFITWFNFNPSMDD